MAKQTFTTGSVLTATQMNNLNANDYNWTVDGKVASYVLVAADAGKRIEMNSGSATTITVNTGLFTAGDMVYLSNIGSGVCTVTAGTATVNKSTNASLALSQYQSGILYFVSASSSIFYPFDIGSAAGGYTSLASGNIGSGGVSLTTISGSYRDLILILRNITSATTAINLQLTWNSLGGDYRWSGAHWGSGTAGSLSEKNGTSLLLTNQGSLDGTKTESYQRIMFMDYANTTNYKQITARSKYITSTGGRGFAEEIWGYYYNDTTAITRIDVTPSAGTITGGTYVLFGVS